MEEKRDVSWLHDNQQHSRCVCKREITLKRHWGLLESGNLRIVSFGDILSASDISRNVGIWDKSTNRSLINQSEIEHCFTAVLRSLKIFLNLTVKFLITVFIMTPKKAEELPNLPEKKSGLLGSGVHI